MAEIPARFSLEEGETLKGRVDDSREEEIAAFTACSDTILRNSDRL